MLSKKNANDCTVEEMVAAVHAGEMEYFEPLFERFAPLVKKFNKFYYLKDMEEEDFRQEARIVLHKALEGYDATRGMRFAGYYKLMLQHHIYSLIRKDVAMKRAVDKESLSYDFLTENNYSARLPIAVRELGKHLSPEDIVQVRESALGYFEILSVFEKQVFRSYLEGKDFQQTALEMGCHPNQVKHAYDRCRQKLKKMLVE